MSIPTGPIGGPYPGVVFLPNALITVARGVYSSAMKSTSAPAPYLWGIQARIEPTVARAYKAMPAAVLTSDYTVTVAGGADIAAGARITAITTLDGVSPWPHEAPTSNEFWEVVYADETSAYFLPQRILYVKRVTGGGASHL